MFINSNIKFRYIIVILFIVVMWVILLIFLEVMMVIRIIYVIVSRLIICVGFSLVIR